MKPLPILRNLCSVRRRLMLALAATATLIVTPMATAQSASSAAADPALEARVKALATELRCLVCQNQTVADSDAPVARDLRDQVRAQLAAGKSEGEVKQYMTDRFGDFVLYKPPLKATTVALWLGPFAALLFAAFLLARRLRQSGAAAGGAPLTDADRDRARALLGDAASVPTAEVTGKTSETSSRTQL